MSRLSTYAGGRAPATTLIVNKWAGGGSSLANIVDTDVGVLATSGSGTANTLATVLNISGAGFCPYLICFSNSAVPTHTVRCQVIVDGVTAFDATSDTITTAPNRGFVVVGAKAISGSAVAPIGESIRFNTSLVVKVASSQSGTDYVALRYNYMKTAY